MSKRRGGKETGMARKRGRDMKLATPQRFIDATPERLAKGDEFEFIDPAKIDSSEQPIGLVRRFRASHLDRLYRGGRLTWAQWYAGDWYRNQHERCRFALSVVSSYGERSSAGEPSYGLARSEAQAQARQSFRLARRAFSGDARFMERLLIEDELPTYGGRASLRNIRRIAGSLDALAGWLMLPVDKAENSSDLVTNVTNCVTRSAAA